MDQSVENQDLGLEIFKLDYLDLLKEKISAIALFEDTVIVGDEHGTVKLFNVTTKNKIVSFEKGKEENMSKNKIEKIICIDPLKVAFFLAGTSVYIYTMPELNNRTPKDKSDPIIRITNNLHKDHLNEILMVTKKRKIRIYQYQTEVFKLIELSKTKEKDFIISEVPDNLCLYDKWLYFSLAEKKTLCVINLEEEKEYLQDVEAESIIVVKDIFLAYTMGMGLYMDGRVPSNKSCIMFDQKGKFINFVYYKNYIITLHDGEIRVYDPEDGTSKQCLMLYTNVVGNSKYLLVNENNIIAITMKQIDKKTNEFRVWKINELPFQGQISNMIKSYNFEEALNILNKNYSTYDPNKVEAIEDYYLECGWASLKKFNKEGYDNAKLYFHVSDVNIYEVIYLFTNLLDVQPVDEEVEKAKKAFKNPEEVLQNESKKEEGEEAKGEPMTLEEIKKLGDRFKELQIENLDNDPGKEYKNALSFLIDFLLDKREYYMKAYNASKNPQFGKITFKVAPNALSLLRNPEEKIYNLEITIKVINLTLVKAMAKSGNMKKCYDIIESDNGRTDLTGDKYLENLNTDDSKMALAYIFEKQEKYKEAMDIWKEFGKEGVHPKYRNPARDRSFRILKSFESNQQYVKLFEENIKWLFHFDKKEAFKTLLEYEMLPIDYVLSSIIPDLEKEKGVEKTYREQFLKEVDESPKRNEKYQTYYVELLVDKLFALHSADLPQPPEDKTILKMYNDFIENLQSMTLYNKGTILEKIKGKWMLELELYLYTELGSFSQALQRLLDIGKVEGNFSKVRKFCEENIHREIGIFTELFKLLSSEYNLSKDKMKEKNIYEIEMLNLLEAFEKNTLLDIKEKNQRNRNLIRTRRFEILNSNEIMRLLPSHWKISNEIVYNYLNLVMREAAHLNNKYKLQKNLVKMDLVYRRNELAELKNKSIEIKNETNCCGCGKKIANGIFVIYPNNKIYHSRCAGSNPSVDPLTNVDFSKKKVNFKDLGTV
ncbi:MAG: hypothetical protein MJ252_19355 [archaeon]|nr:hypothetical protein [archaeon]